MEEPKLDPWPACKPNRHRGGWEWIVCGETKRVCHDSESSKVIGTRI